MAALGDARGQSCQRNRLVVYIGRNHEGRIGIGDDAIELHNVWVNETPAAV